MSLPAFHGNLPECNVHPFRLDLAGGPSRPGWHIELMGATTKHTYSGKSKISDSNDGVLAFPINPMTYPLHMPYGNGVKEALEAKAMVIKHRWYYISAPREGQVGLTI